MFALRGLVPTTRGYAEARVADATMSVLFLDRTRFTFGEMLRKLASFQLTSIFLYVVTKVIVAE